MPRTKGNADSLSKIFRTMYEDKPELLKIKGFDEVATQFLAMYPDREFTTSIRGIAANIKSRMRKDAGIKGRRTTRKAKLAADAAAPAAVAVVNKAGRPVSSLLKLEDAIDDCMIEAKRMDAAKLEAVIKHLRIARNTVIHMQGGA